MAVPLTSSTLGILGQRKLESGGKRTSRVYEEPRRPRTASLEQAVGQRGGRFKPREGSLCSITLTRGFRQTIMRSAIEGKHEQSQRSQPMSQELKQKKADWESVPPFHGIRDSHGWRFEVLADGQKKLRMSRTAEHAREDAAS
ncbi:hypothetical protein QAD02_014499 [Eretmocerus hayati]|uniref:Uncharacterized protein n=1 Tax=Eretmocerus hayati TaxID=131215 RepID=A0ACC2P5N6_9HYME|nr:hypothetical protein QAD02_014499 [Eretmocerus hayati]